MPSDGAGVEKHQIGVLGVVAKIKTHCLKKSFNSLPVADVLLAAVYLNKRLRSCSESLQKQLGVHFAKFHLAGDETLIYVNVVLFLQRGHQKIPSKA